MSRGVTYEQAAAILGCHFSNVAKLIHKGDLTSTGKRGASLDRSKLRLSPNAALLTEQPRPPGQPASISGWTFAPIRTTSGCRLGRWPSCWA